MSEIKFGRAQLKNPTPANWSSAIKVATVVLGAIIAWVGTATFIPTNIATIIQSILGLLLTLSNGLLPFLGVQTNQSDVPIADVASMETDSESKKNI